MFQLYQDVRINSFSLVSMLIFLTFRAFINVDCVRQYYLNVYNSDIAIAHFPSRRSSHLIAHQLPALMILPCVSELKELR